MICASWDRNIYVFDDNDASAREGQFRYDVKGRKADSRQNFVDFRKRTKCTATASDDGYVTVQNHQNQKVEGVLTPYQEGPYPQVKICKFLKGHNCLVSADTDGFLNFYAVAPSPCKNTLPILRTRRLNAEVQIRTPEGGRIEGQEEVFFPIRGIDFDRRMGILYTGDEAGYLQKWDLNPMLNKLRQNEETFKARTEQERLKGLSSAADGS